MAGILTAASTAGVPAPPAKPMTPIPTVGSQPQTAGDLLSASPQQAAANAAPAAHSNAAVNEALMQAFRPVIHPEKLVKIILLVTFLLAGQEQQPVQKIIEQPDMKACEVAAHKYNIAKIPENAIMASAACIRVRPQLPGSPA